MASSTSACLQSLLDMLASPELTSYYSRSTLKSDATLLEMLSMLLVRINAVIDDAEEKAITRHAVKKWLEEVRNALYDLDDALDEIAFDAMRRMQETQSEAIWISQISKKLDQKLSRFRWKAMTSKVRPIAEKVQYLAMQKDVHGLREGQIAQGKSERPPTTYLMDESSIFVTDGATEILNMVISKDASDQIDVLSIVGMGGLGKTTLAQLVYNHEKVSSHFDLKAWIYVGEEFDVRKVTKEILEQVTGQVCEISELNLLQHKLCESLAEKRFLLVLDDVWSENSEDWLLLRFPFQVAAKGNKIVVTTRNQMVAMIMSTMPPFYPGLSSDDVCWSIFSKHAFGYDSRSDPKMEEIGRIIAERCKGLPLAAKLLGGLLRFKQHFEEWQAILKSDVWDIRDMPILPALQLSYHHLSGNLKRCFAYCSLFPRDYEFEKEKLVLLWMAEGLLPRPGSKLVEEVDDSFNELLSRSFFLSSSKWPSRYKMHDLVSDLAHYVSREFCFRLEDSNTSEMPRRVRHASYAARGIQVHFSSQGLEVPTYV